MAYYLRTTDKDGKSHGGFQWPLEIGAIVTAPDWEPTAICGYGLHGLLNGLGNADHLSFDADAVWWIVEADDAVDLDGKHKFQSCRVVAFGPRSDVTAQMNVLAPGAIHGLVMTGGNDAVMTGGYSAVMTGGNDAVMTGGNDAVMTGGNGSTLVFKAWRGGRYRFLIAYVGEDGVLPNVAYRAADDFKSVIPA